MMMTENFFHPVALVSRSLATKYNNTKISGPYSRLDSAGGSLPRYARDCASHFFVFTTTPTMHAPAAPPLIILRG